MSKGLSFDQLYPGTYLKAGEFDGKAVTLTLKHVQREMLSNGTGGEEPAVTVAFEETEKQFVMNKTCAVCLRAMWGDDSGAWIGHRLTLHPVKDESGLSESGQCIRVKGSPELPKPLTFRARLGRKMVTQTLVPTGKNGNGATNLVPDAGRVQNGVESEDGSLYAEAAPDEPDDQIPFGGDDIDEALGNVEPIRAPKASKSQLGTIERLVKSTGLYEAELAGILDSYGAVTLDDLDKKSADFVIAALQERGS